MGFFDNLISLKVSETYDVEKGIEVVRKYIRRYSSIEIINLPLFIIKEFEDLLRGKEAILYKTADTLIPKGYESFIRLNVVKTRITAGYYGEKGNLGLINFGNKASFNITYGNEEIYDISEVNITKCLRCLGRANVHSYYESEQGSIHFGNVYEVPSGLKAMRESVEKSEKITINNLPDFLLREILDDLAEKEPKKVKILVSSNTSLRKELKKFPNARILPKYISTKVFYNGVEVHPGGVATKKIHFGIGWLDEKIFDVRTIEWDKCAECVFNMYNAEWIVSSKIRC